MSVRKKNKHQATVNKENWGDVIWFGRLDVEGMKGEDKDECAHLMQFGRVVRMGGLPQISQVR